MAQRSRKISESEKAVFESIVELTRSFCLQFPDGDFAEICEEMIRGTFDASDCMMRGRPESWAAGTLYTVAWINFLHRKDTKSGLDAETIAQTYDVSTSTIHSKSKALRQALDLIQLDPAYTLPEMLNENPFIWLMNINGTMVDIREASPEILEAAFVEGLIPYIPSKNKDVFPGIDSTHFLMDESSLVDNTDGLPSTESDDAMPQRKRFSMWDVALAGPKWDFDLEPLEKRSGAQRFPRK